MLRLAPPRRPRTILRLDAIFDFVVALVLLVGPVGALYDLFAAPDGAPEVLARLLSLLLFAFAALLWLASTRDRLTLPVAFAAAVANGLAVLLILVWMLTGGSGMGPAGFVVGIALALVLAAFSSLELEIVRTDGSRTGPAGHRP